MDSRTLNGPSRILKCPKNVKGEAKMVEKVSDEGAATLHAEAAPKKIRGRPFQRGNSGRPRGSKNRTTRLLEELVAGDGEKLAQKAVELALAGNVKCLQLCLDRLMPRRVGRPVDFTLPAVNNAHDIVVAMAAVTTAVSDGSLTAEEAGQLVHILNGYAKAVETYGFATRIAALESQIKKSQ